MKLSQISGNEIVGVALLAGMWTLGCSSSSSGDDTASGGSGTTGGATSATGGKSSTGGSSTKTGGASATGGASSTVAKTGGAPATGGAGAGGTSSMSTAKTGGTTSGGGATGVGGVTAVGGVTGFGGVTASGGTTTVATSHPDAAVAFCTLGCAGLSVPITGAKNQTIFDLPLVSTGTKDITDSLIEVRACVQSGTGGGLQVTAQNGATAPDGGTAYGFANNWTDISQIEKCSTGGMTVIEFDLSTAPLNTLDPAAAEKISLTINAGDTGPWTDPTVVYVQSVDVVGTSTGDLSFSFSSASKIKAGTVDTNQTSSLYPGAGQLGINVYQNGTSASSNVVGSTIAFYKG
jgi:hypothetical protein